MPTSSEMPPFSFIDCFESLITGRAMHHSHHIRSNYATMGHTHGFRSRRHRGTTGSVLSPIIPPENALLTSTLVQESKPIGICHRSFPALVRQLDVGRQGTAALGSVILVVSVIVV